MKARSTLILAVIFAALAGYLYFVEMDRVIEDGEGTSAAIELDAAKVSRIELEHPGRKVVLEKRDGGWQMLEPVGAPADQRNVENLITAVAECQVKRSLDAVEDLAVYGLDVPSGTIRLLDGDRSLGVIEIGKQTPVGGAVYIRRNGESAVLLTDATIATRVDQKPEDLRDKAILVFDESAVRSISIAGAADSQTLRIERNDDGPWRIAAPAAYEADQATVGGLLSTLSSMRAIEFLDDQGGDLGRYGLDEPARTLTLDFAAGEPLELRVGNEREGVLSVQTNRRPTVYSVASWVADSVDRDANHFRDKTVASFPVGDAARVEITSADGVTLELSRGPGTGDAPGPWKAGGDDVRQDVVGELLRELSALEGFEIVDAAAERLADFGLDPAARDLRVYDGDGAPLAAVKIGSHAAAGAQTEYAAVDAQEPSTVFHIRDIVYQRLDKGARDLLAGSAGSEGAAPPVPDGEAGDGIDEHPLDDAAAAGE